MLVHARPALAAALLALIACGDDGPATRIDAPVAIDAPVIDAPSIDAPTLTCLDEERAISSPAAMNTFAVDPRLAAPLVADAPDFGPLVGSPALAGGATPPADGFFDATATFRGAIGAANWMRTGTPQRWTQFPTNQTPPDVGTVTTLAGTANVLELTVPTTWTTGNTYKLPAGLKVYVTGGGTLTIQPGTLVKGGVGSAIVVTKSGSIDAQGTANAPIVLTSDQPSGSAAPGNWGGVILLGTAAINAPGGDAAIEGLDAADLRNHYGGMAAADDAHDCGTIRYARIEYAGAIVSPGNEIQGLTMGGCGTGTEIDFLQVHRSSDDGIEIFGGAAGLKHVVITQPDDDGLDWDQGWTGKAQFVIVQHAADRAIEADSNRNNATATPISRPTIRNATFIGLGAAGTRGQKGLLLRRGTGGLVRNTIVAELPGHSVDVDGWPSVLQHQGGNLLIERSMFFHDGTPPAYEDWATGFDTDATTMMQNDCPPAMP